MPLGSLNFALKCDGNELETHGVVQEDPNTIIAFVASEAGKQFRITYTNNLSDTNLRIILYIDGECTNRCFIRAGKQGEILGIRKSSNSVLPFKFQKLEVVDPDLENAPVVPGIGTIELRAFRCRVLRTEKYKSKEKSGLHRGRVSERSKMAGWHHVSTGEVPTKKPTFSVVSDIFDPPDEPYASVKVFYRPRELLTARGVIKGHGVGAGSKGGAEVNDRKRVREDESPSLSKRRAGSTAEKEGISSNAHAQRIQAIQEQIQALQGELNSELNALMTEQSGLSVKRESPIAVGQAAGEVLDLSLDD